MTESSSVAMETHSVTKLPLSDHVSVDSGEDKVEHFRGDIVTQPDGSGYVVETQKTASSRIPTIESYKIVCSNDDKENKEENCTTTVPKLNFVKMGNSTQHRVLMCFTCKLTYKDNHQFMVHAKSAHNIELTEREAQLLGDETVEAVIQLRNGNDQVMFLEKDQVNSNSYMSMMANNFVPSPFMNKYSYMPSGEVNDIQNEITEKNSSLNALLSNETERNDGDGVAFSSSSSQGSTFSLKSDMFPSMIGLELHDPAKCSSSSVNCPKCDMILGSSRSLGGHMTMMHSRNSCKTLKCPKCNWHYKYQQTLDAHMKEKHPESNTNCSYCKRNQPHPRLARGETYSCGYKPFRCDICNYSTTTKGNLSIHMQSDKHLNNVQEMQKSGEAAMMAAHQQSMSNDQNNKNAAHKSMWRCDVCDYETNVGRNLRIHLGSEKHTHNILAQQQQAIPGMPISESEIIHSSFPMPATGQPVDKGELSAVFSEFQPGVQVVDGGYVINPDMVSPPEINESEVDEPKDMFSCSICNNFSTSQIDTLSNHIHKDRSNLLDNDWFVSMNENIQCKLCKYSTTLKANFQLHLKTDKHIQKMSLVNHIKEGGKHNEWRLKYLNLANPEQVKCTACDFYSNNISKLIAHVDSSRHVLGANIFHTVEEKRRAIGPELKVYICKPCNFRSRFKLALLQHMRTMKHLKTVPLLNSFTEHGDLDTMLDVAIDTEGIKEKRARESEEDGFTNAKKLCQSEVEYKLRSCPYCQYSTVESERMNAHLMTQHSIAQQSISLRCPLCQQKFPSRPMLETHLMEIHSVTPDCVLKLVQNVQVEDANESSLTMVSKTNESSDAVDSGPDCIDRATLDVKSANELDPDQYRCQKCHLIFNDIDTLYTHQNEVCLLDLQQTPRGPGYLCWKKGCNQYFKSSAALQMHFKEIHAKRQQLSTVELGEYRFKCFECSLAFKSKEKLQVHAKYHMIRAATTCTLCSKTFRTLGALQKHCDTIHSDLGVANTDHQSEHSATDANDEKADAADDSKLPCDMPLDLSQSGSSNVDDQLNTSAICAKHYDDPSYPLKCHPCKKAFTKSSYLSNHLGSTYHKVAETSPPDPTLEKFNDPNRPFKCQVCHDSFTQKNILLMHYNSVSHLHKLKKVQEEKEHSASNVQSTISDDQKPYKCNVCKVSYSQASTLDIHMRSVLHHTKAAKEVKPSSSLKLEDAMPQLYPYNPVDLSSIYGQLFGAVPGSSTIGLMSGFPFSFPTFPFNPMDAMKFANPTTMAMPDPASVFNPPMFPSYTVVPQPEVSIPSLFSCQKCTSVFSNQESLTQHQQIHCYYGDMSAQLAAYAASATISSNITTSGGFTSESTSSSLSSVTTPVAVQSAPISAISSVLNVKPVRIGSMKAIQRQLLQNIGYELAMQFTENSQNVPLTDLAETLSKSAKIDTSFFKCKECNKVFSGIWVIKAHLEEVHNIFVPSDDVEDAADSFSRNFDKKYSLPDESVISDSSSEMFAKESDASVIQQQSVLLARHLAQSSFIPMLMPSIPPNMLGMSVPGPISSTSTMPPPPSVLPQSYVSSTSSISTIPSRSSGDVPTKRPRTRITDGQLKILRAHFDINNSPSEDQVNKMAAETGLPMKVIKHWFRNTLFKERQRNKDSPYNFNNPPSTILLESIPEREEDQTNQVVEKPVDIVKTEVVDHLEGQDNPVKGADATPLVMPYTPVPSDSVSVPFMFPNLGSDYNQTTTEVDFSSFYPRYTPATGLPLFSGTTSPSLSPSLMSSSQHQDMPSRYSDLQRRACRTRFTDPQIKCLQDFFDNNAYPKDDDLDVLSRDLSLNPRVIVVWFQNQRQKARKSFENIPATDDDGSSRYIKTPGQNYQCKKCMIVCQRMIDLIKHQKESCYSDELSQPSQDMSCGSKSPESVESTEVYSSQHSSTGMQYPCSKCPSVFNMLESWQEHQQEHLMSPSFTSYMPSLVDNNYPGFMYMPPYTIASPFAGKLATTTIPTTSFCLPNFTLTTSDSTPVTMTCSVSSHQNNPVPILLPKTESMVTSEDSNGTIPQKDRRLRTTITPEQLEILFEKYNENSNPSRRMLDLISKDVALKKRVVQVWFQNTRARQRKGLQRSVGPILCHRRCPYCRAMFKAQSALNAHIKTKHWDQIVESKQKGLPFPDGILESDLGNNVDNDKHKSENAQTGQFYATKSLKALLNNQQQKDASNTPDAESDNCEGVDDYDDDQLVIAEDDLDDSSQESMDDEEYDDSQVTFDRSGKVTVSYTVPVDDEYNVESSCAEKVNNGTSSEILDLSRGSDGLTTPQEMYSNIYKNFEHVLSGTTMPAVDVTETRSSTPLQMPSASPRLSSSYSSDDIGSETISYDDNLVNEMDPLSPNKGKDSKRYRTQLSHVQLKILKQCFKDYKTPTMQECEILGRTINLARRVIQVWFQNARAKDKKNKLTYAKHFGMVTEVDLPRDVQCKLCRVKYSIHVTGRDHMFTQKHVEKMKEVYSKDPKPDSLETVSQSSLANRPLLHIRPAVSTASSNSSLPQSRGLPKSYAFQKMDDGVKQETSTPESMAGITPPYPMAFPMMISPFMMANPYAHIPTSNSIAYPSSFNGKSDSLCKFLCNKCRTLFDTRELVDVHQKTVCHVDSSNGETDTVTKVSAQQLVDWMSVSSVGDLNVAPPQRECGSTLTPANDS